MRILITGAAGVPSRILAWDDPKVDIEWLLAEGSEPVLSQKDQKGKSLVDLELFE